MRASAPGSAVSIPMSVQPDHLAAAAQVELSPGFMTVQGRRLFCLRRRALVTPITTRVLVVPPFAEELNKCRRLLALCAQTLAVAGAEVWWPDLSGTGDSAGDFADACWSQWIDELCDLDLALAQAAPAAAPAYLALRSGALLLAAASSRLRDFERAHVLLWQPVLDGGRYLQQFLRLRVMASRLSGRDESLPALMARLAQGELLEVGGYGLRAQLTDGLAAAQAAPATLGAARAVTVLEFKNTAGASPSLPVLQFSAACQTLGCAALVHLVECEQFWATQEISAPTVVIDASMIALLGL